MFKSLAGSLTLIPAVAISALALFGLEPTDAQTAQSINALRDAKTESVRIENQHRAALYSFDEREKEQALHESELRLQALESQNVLQLEAAKAHNVAQAQADLAWANLGVEVGRVAAYCLLLLLTVVALFMAVGLCYQAFLKTPRLDLARSPTTRRTRHRLIALPLRQD
jgi:uncharacterized protein (DUF3084 family)